MSNPAKTEQPESLHIDRIRMMLREDPNLKPEAVRKALSMPTEAAAKHLLQEARDAERKAVERLAEMEESTVDRQFRYIKTDGTIQKLRMVSDDGRKVAFRDL